MIQRIQSIYLLLAAVAVAIAMCITIGSYVEVDGITMHVLKPLGISYANGEFQSTWGLFGLLFLSAVISIATIFLFRNRMLQIRMTIFNAVLLVGYYIAVAVFIFSLKGGMDDASFRPGIGLALPAVSIILCYLAFRGIFRDEVIVKAADRLR